MENNKLLYLYKSFFSLHEIEKNKILQLGLGALIFGYFTSFFSNVPKEVTYESVFSGRYVCPTYFQDCSGFYFFQSLPYGYSQSVFYALLFSCLAWSLYSLFQKDVFSAHIALIPVFVWHTIVTFMMSDFYNGNYEYYLFIFGCSLLILPHKEFFTKLFIVLFYFLSTVTKIHPGWIVGTYFSSLETGLPLFPNWSIPILTNMVIFAEMVMAWFLMSRNSLYQRTALAFFIFFHVYSSILVGFRYPSNILPMVIIMFGPLYTVTLVPLDRKALIGFLLVVMCILGQLTSHLITGDEKLTLEGNKYGLYMFEANHQCISNAQITMKDGTVQEQAWESFNARNRCDPYVQWFRFQTICKRYDEVTTIQWQFDHSINGAPFLRIIDIPNACDVSYESFSHNSWIKTYSDNPEIIGKPIKNFYY